MISDADKTIIRLIAERDQARGSLTVERERAEAAEEKLREREEEWSRYIAQKVEQAQHPDDSEAARIIRQAAVILKDPKYQDELAAERQRAEKMREALSDLLSYARSVWFDEASAIDEEHEAIHRARAALLSPNPTREESDG